MSDHAEAVPSAQAIGALAESSALARDLSATSSTSTSSFSDTGQQNGYPARRPAPISTTTEPADSPSRSRIFHITPSSIGSPRLAKRFLPPRTVPEALTSPVDPFATTQYDETLVRSHSNEGLASTSAASATRSGSSLKPRRSSLGPGAASKDASSQTVSNGYASHTHYNGYNGSAAPPASPYASSPMLGSDERQSPFAHAQASSPLAQLQALIVGSLPERWSRSRQAGSSSSAGGRMSRMRKTRLLLALVALGCLASFLSSQRDRLPSLSMRRRRKQGRALKRLRLDFRPGERTAKADRHRLEDLLTLPYGVDPGPMGYAALLHISDAVQITSLQAIVANLQSQIMPPDEILIVATEQLENQLRSVVGKLPALSAAEKAMLQVSVYPSDDYATSAEAIVEAAVDLQSGFLLLLEPPRRTGTTHLGAMFASSLMHVAATSEYSSAVLAHAGISFDDPSSCVYADTNAKEDAKGNATAWTTTLKVPTGPVLFRTSWVASVDPHELPTEGSLPPGAALSIALSRRSGIPIKLIPFSSAHLASSEHARGAWMIAPDWPHEACAALQDSIDISSLSSLSSPVIVERVQMPVLEGGAMALFVSDEKDLALAIPLACGLSRTHALQIWVALAPFGGKEATDRYQAVIKQCSLDVRPLRDLSLDGDISDEALIYRVRGVMQRHDFDVVLHVTGGVVSSSIHLALTIAGVNFDAHPLDSVVGIEIPQSDIAHVDWLAALPLDAIRSWNVPKIDISVITRDRPDSLLRLMKSVEAAHFLGDRVNIGLNLEQNADFDTHKLVAQLEWPHGTLNIRHRVVVGGLIPAIVESWYPRNNDTYGVFLEDDVEVSPQFYAWLKFTILQYRYDASTKVEAARLFGVSLYQQKNVELRNEGRRAFDAHALFADLGLPATRPYLSQVPCSWGAVYFPEQWKEFHHFLSLRFNESSLDITDLIVPDIKSNRWARSWKKYFIELVYLRGYTMLYPNYADFVSFSTNHLEVGDHVKAEASTVETEQQKRRKIMFEVPLMQMTDSLLDLPDERRLPKWSALPVIDFWGTLTTESDIVERGATTILELEVCPPLNTSTVQSYDARELLCPTENAPLPLEEAREFFPHVEPYFRMTQENGAEPTESTESPPTPTPLLGVKKFDAEILQDLTLLAISTAVPMQY
ncbi:uncharacterized protein L969DRAFT_42203 [Mixia osmundae IAM 14324]|uniref:Uncharacterized protein n=1 Tax=Mixia osmundae (strain CBS 9802 / IAM 14324 / JCM 22182 / KY 12970) TaxID=764103 RepID=G7DZC0_MIXOS|nr:uncharacterized protein L969DRAFT_42203 [Mixia osmundae IAM 14324]KEI42604.1 hypothetical protein L969DRAFT_42203 [Mixia osmundae IAM 14324]GAA95930.1 hypothetical protein E5Q_02588 [Mixia osmundae IAM 14324]